MSPDVSNMFAQFTGAPQTYAPGTYGNVYTAGSVEAASPFPNNYVPPDYGKTFTALSKTGFAIGEAGRAIGGYRTEKAMGKEAQKIARDKAYQLTQKGLKDASRARAITGAQGRTGAGSPLFAELATIQSAVTDARTRLYQGNIEKYYSDERAKGYIDKAPADILKALLQGSSMFKETIK